jgi:DNA repair exonuclease SbcCD ATPase subunit
MLTRIRIVNIQKHKDLELALDKINVIVGATDSGKTSVLRALNWALTNDESGENLINNQGAKSCFVALDADGKIVERSWSKSKNAYSLDDKEFTTFRTSVPEPIKDVLNIADINIQRRRDLPFMVYDRASECASQFSAMMDLSEIDSIIANSNKSVKHHAEQLESAKQRNAEIQAELDSLRSVDDALFDLQFLELTQKEITESEGYLNRLKTLHKQVSDAHCEFGKVTDPAEAEFAVQLIIELNDEWRKVYSKRCDLFNLYDEWVDASLRVKALENVSTLKDYVAILETEYKDMESIADNLKHYRKIYDERKQMIRDEANAMQKYSDLSSEFKTVFPKVCPLCGKENCNEDTLSC